MFDRAEFRARRVSCNQNIRFRRVILPRVTGVLLMTLACTPHAPVSVQPTSAILEDRQPHYGPTSANSIAAVVGVTVIPMDRERVLSGQTVVVQNGRITALGPVDQVRVPVGATTIDGRGKFLIPGLADMHLHLAIADSAHVQDWLFLLVSNGVTTVRDMDYFPKGGLFGIVQLGGEELLRIRARTATGEVLGPRIYTSGYWGVSSMFGGAGTPISAAQVKQKIATYKAAGYDFIKVHDEDSVTYDHLVTAAQQVGISFAGHVPPGISVEHVLATHQASIEHLRGYMPMLRDPSRLPSIVAATVQAHVWNCPTLMLAEFAAGTVTKPMALHWPEARYLAPETAQRWATATEPLVDPNAEARSADPTPGSLGTLPAARHLVKSLQDAGGGLLLGTDTPLLALLPGFGVHHELEAMVRAGLTPYQALATGTRNVAMFFGTLNESGTIAVGKRADLVLLERNPLQDITNTQKIAGVMLAGRWLSRMTLDQRLDRYVGKWNSLQ